MIGRRSFVAGVAATAGGVAMAGGVARPAAAQPRAPADGTVAVGPGRAVTTLAHAARLPGVRTLLVDPGTYRESVDFRAPVTLQAADWRPGARPSVVIDGGNPTTDIRRPALPLVEDKALILARADIVIRGVEITGAAGRNALNGAGVRNDPGRAVTLEDCVLHHNQANLLVTGGTITVRRTALHHNTGDNQAHNLYYASFRGVAPGTLLVEDCRIYHSAAGNNLKSNARSTIVRRSFLGTVPVPAGTSDKAWLEPKPAQPGTEWLMNHPGCVAGGATCDGKELDVSYGGDLLVEDCDILKVGSAGGYFLGYGFEGAQPGEHRALVTGSRFTKGRDPCYLGNRVPGARLEIRDCRFAGTYDHRPTVLDTADPRTHQPVPGAAIVLVGCRGA